MTAPIEWWVAGRPDVEVRGALERLAGTADVQRIAVMPDVHLANGVCIGTVTATSQRLLPGAVGGDIGCGVAAVRFAASADLVDQAVRAAAVLAGLYRAIPFIKHASRSAPPLPTSLVEHELSAPALEALKQRDGRLQLGTLGRGNHFLELQRDEAGELWLMVHSGSRAMGPAIRDHHARAAASDNGLHWLDAASERGGAYLRDLAWAREYARHNRLRMIDQVDELFAALFAVRCDRSSLVDCDHNHVTREAHPCGELWVHRKGALRARAGEPGVIPGSMGSPSYHVIGRGHAAALCSSSHGAGRSMSRSDARRRVSTRRLLEQVEGVWFDHRLSERLREEAPAAYKDIGAVMRAQHELTCITRKLQPVLVYKGG
jgi:tRNA-splicing ligase RtcB